MYVYTEFMTIEQDGYVAWFLRRIGNISAM